MKNVTILLAVAVVVALSVPAYATTDTKWTGTTGNWTSSGDWNNGAPGDDPSEYYTATIDTNSGIVQITSTVNIGSKLTNLLVGYKAGNVCGLEIGADLYVGTSSGGMYVGCGTMYDASDPTKLPSTVTQTAGKVWSGTTIHIGTAYAGTGNASTVYDGNGKWTISGGSIEQGGQDIQLGGRRYGDGIGHGHLKVVGSGASKIGCTNYDQLDDSVLEFVFGGGDTPIQQIDVTGTASLTGTLNVSGTADAGTYTIIDYGTLSGTFNVAVNLPTGWSMDYNDGGKVTVTAIPEPATMCLLAVGGIGVLIRRRRK